MARGEIIWVEVDGQKRSLRAWALENDKNPFTLLRRYRRGITDPFEMLDTRPRRPETKPRKTEDLIQDYTPEDLTTREVAILRNLSYASEGQPDHWKIMCDLAGVSRKHAKKLKEVLGDH